MIDGLILIMIITIVSSVQYQFRPRVDTPPHSPIMLSPKTRFRGCFYLSVMRSGSAILGVNFLADQVHVALFQISTIIVQDHYTT